MGRGVSSVEPFFLLKILGDCIQCIQVHFQKGGAALYLQVVESSTHGRCTTTESTGDDDITVDLPC